MKKYYLFVLLFLSTIVPLVQAANVSIVPKDQHEYDVWEPTYDNVLTFLVSVTGVQSSGSISFSFTKVSSWDGVYMNKDSTIVIENSRPDLRFYSEEQSKDAFANEEKARLGEVLPAGLPAPSPPGSTRNPYDPTHVTWTVPEDGSTDERLFTNES